MRVSATRRKEAAQLAEEAQPLAEAAADAPTQAIRTILKRDQSPPRPHTSRKVSFDEEGHQEIEITYPTDFFHALRMDPDFEGEEDEDEPSANRREKASKSICKGNMGIMASMVAVATALVILSAVFTSGQGKPDDWIQRADPEPREMLPNSNAHLCVMDLDPEADTIESSTFEKLSESGCGMGAILANDKGWVLRDSTGAQYIVKLDKGDTEESNMSWQVVSRGSRPHTVAPVDSSDGGAALEAAQQAPSSDERRSAVAPNSTPGLRSQPGPEAAANSSARSSTASLRAEQGHGGDTDQGAHVLSADDGAGAASATNSTAIHRAEQGSEGDADPGVHAAATNSSALSASLANRSSSHRRENRSEGDADHEHRRENGSKGDADHEVYAAAITNSARSASVASGSANHRQEKHFESEVASGADAASTNSSARSASAASGIASHRAEKGSEGDAGRGAHAAAANSSARSASLANRSSSHRREKGSEGDAGNRALVASARGGARPASAANGTASKGSTARPASAANSTSQPASAANSTAHEVLAGVANRSTSSAAVADTTAGKKSDRGLAGFTDKKAASNITANCSDAGEDVESEYWVADNSEMGADSFGLAYRKNLQLADKVGGWHILKWGDSVSGKLTKDGGWLQVGDFFLPVEIGGVRVLSQQEQKLVPCSERHKVTAARLSGGVGGKTAHVSGSSAS